MRALIVLCSLTMVLAVPQSYSYQQTFNSATARDFQDDHAHAPVQTESSSHASGEQTSQAGQSFYTPNFLQKAADPAKVKQNLYTSISASASNSATASHSPSAFASASQYYPSVTNSQTQHFQPSFGYSPPSAASSTYNQKPQALFTPNHAPSYNQEPAYSFGQQQEYYKTQGQHHGGQSVTKDIYVHVAPRELEQQTAHGPVYPPAPPRKHYRIVFIKAPTPPAPAAVHLQQAPVEEKTIIYVLTKKADPLDIKAIQEASQPKQIHKPEVYFIKYKTQEEAKQAQLSIQAEYDKLGGTSQVSDEGIAPVTSVIGAFDQPGKQQQPNSGIGHTGIDLRVGFNTNSIPSTDKSSANNYLPPYKLRV